MKLLFFQNHTETNYDKTHIFVNLLKFSPIIVVVFERLDGPVERLEAAGLPELVVAGNAVVAAALKVQGQKVLAEVLAFAGNGFFNV